MHISLVRIEGNRYAAFINDDESKEMLMFLGYHFTNDNKTLQDILQDLQTQLYKVSLRICYDHKR